MITSHLLRFLALPAACLALAACATSSSTTLQTAADGSPINPYPPGTYEHFRAEPDYPKTYNFYRNDEVLSRTNPENSRILIQLAGQRGLLLNGDEVALDYPICSGRPSHPTPPGRYEILKMVVDKSSNKYGRIYDADGNMVNGDADATKDPIPEGGKFVGAPMPYWMRMTWSGIGHHVGPMRRVPSSRACIRGPASIMPIVYSKVRPGTEILVE